MNCCIRYSKYHMGYPKYQCVALQFLPICEHHESFIFTVTTNTVYCFQTFVPQIREQMSGPEISWYGESILGCGLWPGLDCGKKGSGPIMSNFWGLFFLCFPGQKIFFLSHWKVTLNKGKKSQKNLGSIFYGGNTSFLGLKLPM